MKKLTREQLEAMVPIVEETVKLEDIPEPYRTQFLSDSIGSTLPERGVHYAWDWQKWLSIYFRDQKEGV